jgi:hypothetical protein
MRSLHALLSHVIDYAGLYPPAALPMSTVVDNYARYQGVPEAWMLNRLVLPASVDHFEPGWRVTLLVDDDPGPPLAPQVETLETKLPRRLSLPTYCEVPLDRVPDQAFAKIRTSDITSAALADFLFDAAARRLPFKATAGLHHPIRAGMHGFLNVFIAAAFAWYGAGKGQLIEILDETHAQAFDFRDDDLRWHGLTLATGQIQASRRHFAHSFGSCSFEEPVNDLRALGLL